MSDKRNDDIKYLEACLKQANKIKAEFENKFNKLKDFNDKLREYYPDLPLSPSIEDAEPYIKINKEISKLTKAIEKQKTDNK